MKKIVNINEWKRKDLFDHYSKFSNPFMIVSTQIDITRLYNYVKSNDLSMYASFGFYLLKIINEFDSFKYRKEDNNLVLFDKVNANFTDSVNGNDIFFFTVKDNNDIKDFNKNYYEIKNDFIKNNKKYTNTIYGIDEVWFTCTPWCSFNAITPPYNKDNYIPQFIWDKFKKDNDKITTNLMVMVHHGFMDGYQLGLFFSKLQDLINSI